MIPKSEEILEDPAQEMFETALEEKNKRDLLEKKK